MVQGFSSSLFVLNAQRHWDAQNWFYFILERLISAVTGPRFAPADNWNLLQSRWREVRKQHRSRISGASIQPVVLMYCAALFYDVIKILTSSQFCTITLHWNLLQNLWRTTRTILKNAFFVLIFLLITITGSIWLFNLYRTVVQFSVVSVRAVIKENNLTTSVVRLAFQEAILHHPAALLDRPERHVWYFIKKYIGLFTRMLKWRQM